MIEIECYECGVTDFDGKIFQLKTSGYTADNSSYIEVENPDNIDFSSYTNYSYNYATLKFLKPAIYD